MIFLKRTRAHGQRKWLAVLLLLAAAVLSLGARPAHAGDNCVANYGGVLNGQVTPVPPSQVQIDGNCTFENYPASDPLTTNISFYTQPGRNLLRWLVIFSNVDFIGNISCDKVQGNAIWFVNGSTTTVRPDCENLFVPVEKIEKQNPAGQTTAVVGVPFTYKLTFPVLYSPLSGAVIDTSGSTNNVYHAVITDDLNATGASLTYLSYRAYWKGSGASVPLTFSNSNGVLTFSGIPEIPAGRQIVIAVTVVLNDTPANAPGTQFSNTATWTFGRYINGVYYEPLPGESGTTPPMTIAAPNLVLTKSGPAKMTLGQWGQFGLDVHNTGTSDAWNVTLLDRLPRGATGGMCNTTPQILSAQVFEADGVTPVPGKGPLVAGTDYSLHYSAGPTCELTMTMLTSKGTIGPGERLVVKYQAKLDSNSQNGVQLTNVAGAVKWYDAGSNVTTRVGITRTLTDGTPGVPDFQDAHTVTVALSGLQITKQVSVVGGGAAMSGGQLEYLVHVTNAQQNPATSVVITDDLGTASGGRLTIVPKTATMNGSTAGISSTGSVLTANFSSVYGSLQPGQSIDLRFRASIASGLPAGTTLTNTAVVAWDTPPETAAASASVDVGGVPGVGALSGTVWHDSNFNKVPDSGETRLKGWLVNLYLNGVQVQSTTTDAGGVYHFTGLQPSDQTGQRYELQFMAPGATPTTAKLGLADSTFTNGLQRITDISVPSGGYLQNLNLPIQPDGVVYNALTRTPIAGATLTLVRGGTNMPLPGSCFDDPAQQNQVTRASGWYRFDLNFSQPDCPSGADYVIQVTAPGTVYVAGPSKIIPPSTSASTGPFLVPPCPGSAEDALPGTPYCEAQTQSSAPPPSVTAGGAGTRYYLHLTFDNTQIPGSNQVYNNHIPIDPQLSGALAITKTTPDLNVTRGQLVPYTITVTNVLGAVLQGARIVDRFPPGFVYVRGSARLDGSPKEPTISGRELSWSGITFGATEHHKIVLLLAVGAGVSEGEFVNRAQVMDVATGGPLSGVATATVRVVPDPTFDCTDVYGKVFDDVNRNGRQDPGERGLPGVHLVTTRGLVVTTDAYGRFHITCPITPVPGRGSNFVLKLDTRTLPSGYRMSTPAFLVERATRGKALRFDFGASIFRVVGLDLANGVFEPHSTRMRPQWRPRIMLLLKELRKAPAVLHLTYLADLENPELVRRRVSAVKGKIAQAWRRLHCCYRLRIATEVYWRFGGPPKQTAIGRARGDE